MPSAPLTSTIWSRALRAAKEVSSPLILQVSAGARKYAKHGYLMKLVEAAVEDTGPAHCPSPGPWRGLCHLQGLR